MLVTPDEPYGVRRRMNVYINDQTLCVEVDTLTGKVVGSTLIAHFEPDNNVRVTDTAGFDNVPDELSKQLAIHIVNTAVIPDTTVEWG
jgi:hypothetical protein